MKNTAELGRHEVELAVVDTFSSARGGQANVLQATPLKAHDDSLPLYFHGGYGVISAPYLQYIAQQYGRRVFTVFYDDRRRRDAIYWVDDQQQGEGPRSVGRKEVRRLQSLGLGSVVSQSQIDMGTDIVTAIEKRRFGRVEAIAQSVGALRATAAAKLAPDLIANMVLPYPAGSVKAEIGRVMQGMGNYVKAWRSREIVPHHETIHASLAGGIAQFERKRLLDIITDGENVLLSCHVSELHRLRQSSNSLGLAIVAGENDQIMMPHRILEGMAGQEDIDYLHVVRGLHAIRHRKAVLHLIMSQFPKLEARKEQRARAAQSNIQLPSLRERVSIEQGVAAAYAKVVLRAANAVPKCHCTKSSEK